VTPDDLRRRKRSLRTQAGSFRDSLSTEDRARRSEAVARNVLALPAVADATTVMAFSSFGSEVDTRPLIEGLAHRQVRLVLPRVEGRSMVAVVYRPGDPVREASFGAFEPAGGEVVGPETIDVVVSPGLAFDRRGYRLGYGGGFYDRFLRRLRQDAVTIGVAFSVQLVDEVPHGRGDHPVDVVVTEEGVMPAAT
jgi:5-formyltetrahydrofolate cyclo-ligase